MWIWELFGAGYGNRTRDRGLGSDCFTIKLILHGLYYNKQVIIIQAVFVDQTCKIKLIHQQIFHSPLFKK